MTGKGERTEITSATSGGKEREPAADRTIRRSGGERERENKEREEGDAKEEPGSAEEEFIVNKGASLRRRKNRREKTMMRLYRDEKAHANKISRPSRHDEEARTKKTKPDGRFRLLDEKETKSRGYSTRNAPRDSF